MRTGQRNFTLYSMKTFFSLFIVILIPLLMSATAFAADEVTAVSGQIYEFDKDSHYDFQENETSQKTSVGNTWYYLCNHAKFKAQKDCKFSFGIHYR